MGFPLVYRCLVSLDAMVLLAYCWGFVDGCRGCEAISHEFFDMFHHCLLLSLHCLLLSLHCLLCVLILCCDKVFEAFDFVFFFLFMMSVVMKMI